MSEDVKQILVGLAILLGFLAVLTVLSVPFFVSADNNRQKVERLTSVCVERGYTGWQDDTYREGKSGCYR